MKVSSAVLLLTLIAFPALASSSQAVFQVEPWDNAPDPDATGNLIFNSVSSLLQRWPNALWRHGHTIVPATIPVGTILYHGSQKPSLPDNGDWVAFDFEHAYIFCHEECHVFSLITTRELKLVYFDGASAAKMRDGNMDTQDLFVWGEVKPDLYWDELERIKRLCEWGTPRGIDGFVRMEFHFEIMYCNFTGGLEVVSLTHNVPKTTIFEEQTAAGGRFPTGDLPPFKPRPDRGKLSSADRDSSPPTMPPPTHPPEGWKGSLPYHGDVFWEALMAGSWHDRAPGETRVHLDYAGLITFYDPSLTSLIPARRAQPHAQHRLRNISSSDTNRKITELEDVLARRGTQQGSGVDWQSVARVVVERYADRLELLNHTLSSSTLFPNATERALSVRTQVLTMLAPYMTVDAVPVPGSAPTENTTWAAPIVERCASTQTSRIPHAILTAQERLIHASVTDTLHEICRRLALIWVNAFDIEAADAAYVGRALEDWTAHVTALMAWLDWSVWVKCIPACDIVNVCTIPTWPFVGKDEDPDVMTARCVPRLLGPRHGI